MASASPDAQLPSRSGSRASRRSVKQQQKQPARAAGPDADSSSETHAASTLHTTKAKETAPSSLKKKRGLFSAFFGALCSCLAPHDVDDDKPTTAAKTHNDKPRAPNTTAAHDPAITNEKTANLPAHKPEASASTTLAASADDTPKPLPHTPAVVVDELVAPVPVKPFVAPTNDGEPAPVGAMPAWAAVDDDVDIPAGITSGAVMPPGATGDDALAHQRRHDDHATDGSDFTDDDEGDDLDDGEVNELSDVDAIIQAGGLGIPIGPDGTPQPLLPPAFPEHAGRKCLVLDLDETLVHSAFKQLPNPDYVIPFEYEMQLHSVYVVKRPGVDAFLKAMGEIYEVVVFTASVSKYADAVLDKLDIHKAVHHRLFRESCVMHRGLYVKDLSRLGRPIQEVIILDNSPASYIFHPNNAVPVSSWFSDPHDTELPDLAPFLDDLRQVDDIRGVLDGGR